MSLAKQKWNKKNIPFLTLGSYFVALIDNNLFEKETDWLNKTIKKRKYIKNY